MKSTRTTSSAARPKSDAHTHWSATRPQTLYGLADSPIVLAGWLLDHGDGYTQPAAALTSAVYGRTVYGESSGAMTRDDVLDDITLYWLTNTGVSASRFYWESHFNFLAADVRPGCRERVSARELPGAAKLDRACVSQPHLLHFKERAALRAAPLRELETFYARNWTLTSIEVRIDTGKFVTTAWERVIGGVTWRVVVGFHDTIQTVIPVDPTRNLAAPKASPEFYEFVDRVNRELMKVSAGSGQTGPA